MGFWARFEEFFIKWFCGPDRDPSTLREYAYTVGALESDRPGFNRNNVVDWSTALGMVRDMYRSENHYLSILFFDEESRARGYRYLYYDFDSEEDPDIARREAMEFVKSLGDRFGVEPVVYFSGRKGYGVLVLIDRYIDFATYRKIWRALLAPFTFSTVDTKVLDARRVHRIPYTYNVKRGSKGFSYLVDPKSFKRIRMEDFDWGTYQPLRIDSVKHLLVEIEGFRVSKPKRFVKRDLVELPSDPAELDRCDAVPPCVRNIVETLKSSGNPDHFQRLALVWYLKWVGYPKDSVLDLFKRYASDFNERVASYQIEYAYGERGKREDWLAPSCRWMKEHSLCLECGWNRNIVTYTYARARIDEEVKTKFFEKVKKAKI